MGDLAPGPASGYIYQFELALIELSQMRKGQFLSVEKMDDLAIEDDKGTYMLTVQAKHSISASGKSFGSTSEDLWKTVVNWIKKIKNKQLNEDNEFRAVTNTKIPQSSIIRKFDKPLTDLLVIIKEILENQKEKLRAKKEEGKKASSIISTIERLEYVLDNINEFEIILNNFQFEENYKIKENFLSKIQMETVEEESVKDNIFEGFLGWIISKSKEVWNNKGDISFSKKDFENKYHQLRDLHPLKKAYFRNKKEIAKNENIDFSNTGNDLYVKQIDDFEIGESDKEEIIREAIQDFILRDIEISYIIKNNNMITKIDLEDFEEKCIKKWRNVRLKYAPRKIDKYDSEELNEIGFQIFVDIMNEVKIEFLDNFGFDDSNEYIQKGTFLNLSNIPTIGWNPNWEQLYKNE